VSSSEADPDTERLTPDELPQPLSDTAPQRPVAREAQVLAGLLEHERTRRKACLPERYELGDELGRGGMAVVHRAHDRELDREVAVKFLRDDYLTDAEAEQRFRREAESTAKLNHPQIVTVHDAGPGFLVMELVSGGSLAELLIRDQPPARRVLVALLERVARAMHVAHQAGIIHRDLKPGNVLIVDDEQPKVADFGLAHLVGDRNAMTATGAIMGTPAYMSPEQAAGDPVTTATDVYALGAMLYECLCGAPPYRGDSPMDVLRRIADSDPAPLRDVPTDLATIVGKAMAREPARRYDSAGALADDLVRWLEGLAIQARPPTLFYLLRKYLARRRSLVAIGLLGLLAVFVAVASLLPPLLHTRRVLLLWSDVSVHLADAELYARAGEVKLADERSALGIARCQDFLTKHEAAEAHYFLGRLLAQTGKQPQAIAQLDHALALDPQMGEARLARGLLRVRAYDRRMMRYYRRYAGRPPDSSAPGPTGASHERRDSKLAELRKQAIADLSVEIGRSAYFKPVHSLFGRAELHRLRWEFAPATARYREVIAAEPLYYQAHLALARMALLRTQHQAAITHATHAIDKHKGHGPSYLVRGSARFWLGYSRGRLGASLIAGATKDLDLALSLLRNPADRSDALTARGQLRIKTGKPVPAMADLDAALKLMPANAVALNARAVLRIDDDKYTLARKDLDQALRFSPTYAQAYYNRALLRMGLGDLKGAVADARQALQWSPKDSALRAQAKQFIRRMGPR